MAEMSFVPEKVSTYLNESKAGNPYLRVVYFGQGDMRASWNVSLISEKAMEHAVRKCQEMGVGEIPDGADMKDRLEQLAHEIEQQPLPGRVHWEVSEYNSRYKDVTSLTPDGLEESMGEQSYTEPVGGDDEIPF